MTEDSRMEIYQGPDGETRIKVAFEADTVWLTQAQMVNLFKRDVSVISRHIRNAINEGEVSEESNLQKMQIANSDKPVTFYDLDVVISVGYRVKSAQGVLFRRWATQRLKEYLARGEASDLFGRASRRDSLAGIFGNLDQSVFGQPVINDTGLAALTLLVAESVPAQKETLIKLIMNLPCDPKRQEEPHGQSNQ